MSDIFSPKSVLYSSYGKFGLWSSSFSSTSRFFSAVQRQDNFVLFMFFFNFHSVYDAPYKDYEALVRKPQTDKETGFNMTAIRTSVSDEQHRILKLNNKVRVNFLDLQDEEEQNTFIDTEAEDGEDERIKRLGFHPSS